MPVIHQFGFHESLTGIWQITETSGQLLTRLAPDKEAMKQYRNFTHEQRKKQWLAYRLILKHLLSPSQAGIRYDIHGKPFLISGSHHISVSHAGTMAAAVCNRKFEVGIDIETIKDRLARVKERFLNRDELDHLDTKPDLELLYIHWCGKEALYKLLGTPDTDFKKDIHIHAFDYLCHSNGTFIATLDTPAGPMSCTLFYRKVQDYMLVVANREGAGGKMQGAEREMLNKGL